MAELPNDVCKLAVEVIGHFIKNKMIFTVNEVLEEIGWVDKIPSYFWSLSQEIYNRYAHRDKLFEGYGYHWFNKPRGARTYFPLPQEIVEYECSCELDRGIGFHEAFMDDEQIIDFIVDKLKKSNKMIYPNNISQIIKSFSSAEVSSGFVFNYLNEQYESGSSLLDGYALHWPGAGGIRVFYPIPESVKEFAKQSMISGAKKEKWIMC